ncbi:MAG TPA: hypothetical protein VF103_15800 [Polyangiaceae bacterium]
MRASLRLVSFAAIAVSAFCLGACSSDDSEEPAAADLPSDWQGAERVTNLMQLDCEGSPLEGSNERATFLPGDGSLGVQYEEAHFRCQQDVEGFFKDEGETLDILVQPNEMHPTSVARCDCLYDITMAIEPLGAGSRQVTLFRRWDDINEPNDPVQIGSELVTIE